MIRKAVTMVALAVLLIGSVVIYRAATFAPVENQVQQPYVQLDVADDIAPLLAGAVAIPTISALPDATERGAQFTRFHAYLREQFPLVHRHLELERINDFGLLYTWPGANRELKPILLLSHQDVVPIEPGTESDWEHPPFAATIADGYVWGRGAWDDKSTLVASLEAVEMLLAENRRPERTIMLAFGHDEEIGGQLGAVATARLMADRGLRFALVLDEGTPIQAAEVIPGVPFATAMISIAEKGYLTLELSVSSPGGHSSMPPPSTAIGTLATAVARLQDNPLPAALNEPVRAMYATLGPHLPFGKRLVLANLWLFEPLVIRQLEQSRATNAAIRTTTAPTIFRAGVKENVLPQSASVTVNFRIAPGESSDSVIAAVRDIVDDPEIEISAVGALSSEPSPVSSVDGWGFRQVKNAILQTRPDVVVVPALLFGATDSRHYAHLSDQVFKFTPITYTKNDAGRIHGTNERMSIEDINNAVRFYYHLIVNASMVAQN